MEIQDKESLQKELQELDARLDEAALKYRDLKEKIKAMIPSLSDAFAHSLAKEFDLSGGQIENVARKRTVELILSGEEPSEEKIREYCMGEIVNSRQDTRAKIGFLK